MKERDGYGKRVPYPSPFTSNSTPYDAYPQTGYESPNKEGGDHNWTLRGKLKYDGGSFRVTLSGDYQRNSSTVPNSLLQTTETAPGVNFAALYNACVNTAAGTLTSMGLANLCSSFGTQYPSVRRNEVTQIQRVYGLMGVNADSDPNNDRLSYNSQFITNDPDLSYANGNNFSHLTNWGLTLNGELDLTPDLLLKSITGYRHSRWVSGMDADGSPLDIFQLSFNQKQTQFSQEFQLVGHALDNKLNYVLGAYYFKEHGYLLDLVTFAEGMDQIDGPNWLKTENYAAFGQVDYRMSDLIGITVGGRFTHENKSFEGGQQEVNGLFYKLAGFLGVPGGSACADTSGNIYPDYMLSIGMTCREALGYPTDTNPLRIYPTGINHAKFNNFSPKLGVQLHPADDLMLYGSWSKGYKTGGWTTRYTTPQTSIQGYKPEQASTFEIGVKSQWLGRRLQVNAAAFTTSYTDIQLNYQVGTSPTIANVGSARIKGLELEVVARPIPPLTVNAAVGYTDAYYTALNPAVAAASGPSEYQAGAVVGGPLPKTPKWKVNVGPRLELPIGNGGALVVQGDYTYTSAMANNVERTYALIRGSTSMVNASIAYTDPSDHYTVTVGASNLTNTRYIASGTAIIASGVISGTYNRPREWYARLAARF